MKKPRVRLGIQKARRFTKLVDNITVSTEPGNPWHSEASEIYERFTNDLLSERATLLALDRLEFIWKQIQTAQEYQLQIQIPSSNENETP